MQLKHRPTLNTPQVICKDIGQLLHLIKRIRSQKTQMTRIYPQNRYLSLPNPLGGTQKRPIPADAHHTFRILRKTIRLPAPILRQSLLPEITCKTRGHRHLKPTRPQQLEKTVEFIKIILLMTIAIYSYPFQFLLFYWTNTPDYIRKHCRHIHNG